MGIGVVGVVGVVLGGVGVVIGYSDVAHFDFRAALLLVCCVLGVPLVFFLMLF